MIFILYIQLYILKHIYNTTHIKHYMFTYKYNCNVIHLLCYNVFTQ